MELGEKLRQARLEAGLSQRQLCGQEITRNMLSQIESGKAKPSMGTLQYLSSRLDKPMAYFLGEEAAFSPSQSLLRQVREDYSAGRYADALANLDASQTPSPESEFLRYLCLLALAGEALAQGKRPYAIELLHKAEAVKTLYRLAPLEQERLLLLTQAGMAQQLPEDPRPLLYRAEKALEEENASDAIRYLEAIDSRDSRWALLRGKAALLAGAPKEALALLQQAEPDYPKQAIPMLEQCCKELEDYKQAYYYACLQR